MEIHEVKYVRRISTNNGYRVNAKIKKTTGMCAELILHLDNDAIVTIDRDPDTLIDMILACARPT